MLEVFGEKMLVDHNLQHCLIKITFISIFGRTVNLEM